MGKRSDFARRPSDAYQTPPEAVWPLRASTFLRGVHTFAEPCAGEGKLIKALEAIGLKCTFSGDISTGFNALTSLSLEVVKYDAIITNPPWTREIMHPMIERFQKLAPTWLLFDADWAHTKQAIPYLDQCSHIVSVGRIKWIEGSKHTGKDNCAWYRFHCQHTTGPHFYSRPAPNAPVFDMNRPYL